MRPASNPARPSRVGHHSAAKRPGIPVIDTAGAPRPCRITTQIGALVTINFPVRGSLSPTGATWRFWQTSDRSTVTIAVTPPGAERRTRQETAGQHQVTPIKLKLNPGSGAAPGQLPGGRASIRGTRALPAPPARSPPGTRADGAAAAGIRRDSLRIYSGPNAAVRTVQASTMASSRHASYRPLRPPWPAIISVFSRNGPPRARACRAAIHLAGSL
jgi:hypothetical protein